MINNPIEIMAVGVDHHQDAHLSEQSEIDKSHNFQPVRVTKNKYFSHIYSVPKSHSKDSKDDAYDNS